MIDIHCHILHNFDDGADSMEESISLARQAVDNGITHVIATPHHYARGYFSQYDQIKTGVTLLNDQLTAMDISLEVSVGQEVRIYDQLLADFEKGQLATLASSGYMLIEFPSSRVPSDVEALFHELQLMNITPIVAHPERNSELANDISKLARLIEGGALAQMTSSSIAGRMGKKLQKQSIEMCKKGLVHFVASDAHHTVKRPFDLKEGYQTIERQLGSGFTQYYQLNAMRLLRNEEIPRDVPIAKRRFILW